MFPNKHASLDATAQAALVRAGDLTPAELVTGAIERIERLNPTLNAVIHERFEKALAEAKGVDREAPFAGVPYVAKDAGCATMDDPYHVGLGPLRDAGHRAPFDSEIAIRFRDAGFICVGRTNVPQLLVSVTTEPTAYGPTRNPWDAARSPGGSSGGTAAAVASGMVPLGHANDAGGSIRIPATSCGLVGLKPTRGRVSDGSGMGLMWGGLSHEFALTRTIRDTAALLESLAGRAMGDPWCAPPVNGCWAGSAPGRLRVRVVAELARQPTDPQVRDAVEAAARILEGLGHHVEPGTVAELEEEGRFGDVMGASIARDLARLAAAAGISMGPDDLEPMARDMVREGLAMSAVDYQASLERMRAFGRRVEANWRDLDILLTPTVAVPQARIGELAPDADLDVYRQGLRARTAFTAAFNVSGQPAISLPLFESAAGLPIGVQLVAAVGREDLLLRVAAQMEEALPWADRRPAVWG